MQKTNEAMYLAQNWLDGIDTTTTELLNTLQWVSPSYTWGYTSPVKIRLKLSEVEKLREAAREDEALKPILRKIAPHVEVVVDFD